MEEITGTAPNYWLEGSFASDLTNCEIALTIENPPGTSSDEVLGAAGKESTESARAECGEGKLTGGGSTHCGFERSTRDGPRAKPAGQSRHARGRMIANNPRNVHSRGSSERGEGRSQSRTSSYFSQ